MRHVIIGNGVAGITAAEQIRNRDRSAEITIISKESDHFFSRTALMYLACGQLNETDIEPFPRDHYQRMDYRRVRGEVVRLDHESNSVLLSDKSKIEYNRLLIASGSVARMANWPGVELDGVCNFVTWQNYEKLSEEMKTARTACVVGGGLIGIEVAEILLRAGIETHFIIREDSFWPIALDQTEGMMIVEHMRKHNCHVHLTTEMTELVGDDGRVRQVILNNGQKINCDLVVVCIGVMPQTGWLKESAIEIDQAGGIVVDKMLGTSLPDVFAAGDCTSVVWFNGVSRPEQLWYTSRDQGRVAGVNMVGDNREYERKTFYNSAKLFDIEYTTAGYVNFGFDGEKNWFWHEAGTYHTSRITYLPDETVVGFNFLGRRWDHRLLVKWVEQKQKLPWVLENLHRANFDEELYPKFKMRQEA